MIAHSPLCCGLFVGAGVSTPIAPATADLTHMIRYEVNDYFIHTDNEWYFAKGTPGPQVGQAVERRARVGQLVPVLTALVERYYGERVGPGGCPVRVCNYEDIAYLASSLADTLTRERDDPGLLPLVELICAQLGWSAETLRDTAEDTMSFIARVVFIQLVDRHPTPDHLQLVLDAAQDPDVRHLPIYSLNHDCLIEERFAAANVSLFDFRRVESDGRQLLDLGAAVPVSARAVLYKAHGCLRWRRFGPLKSGGEPDPWANEWLGWDLNSCGKLHDNGISWRSIGPAVFLVGRFNKELNYLDAPFSQMYMAVSRSVQEQRQIVVSGYGFGDKAMNTLLINWLYGRPMGERRLIVMHADKEALLASARGAIRNKWGGWVNEGRLLHIPYFPRDFSWGDLKAALLAHP